MLMRPATVVQVLQDLFYVLLHAPLGLQLNAETSVLQLSLRQIFVNVYTDRRRMHRGEQQ